MKDIQQKGFTLVELAIVMTIIGLLIGGILKGKAIWDNARVTSTIAQVTTIDSAVKLFKDTYSGQLPGDMLNAQNRLPNCAKCGTRPDTTPLLTPVAASTDGSGNGIIGEFNWDMQTFQSQSYAAPVCPTDGTPCGGVSSLAVSHETVLFWYELSVAGLMTGINDDGINDRAASFGGSLPSGRIGGGFVVGYANPLGNIPGRPIPYNMQPGTVLVLQSSPMSLTSTLGMQVLSPTFAAQMDRRIDDGLPDTGFVQAYGEPTTCFGATAPYAYQEAIGGKDCGLYFRIDKQ